MMRFLTSALAGMAIASAPVAAATYDAVADFSTTSATGTWSYGFGTLGTSFTTAAVGTACAVDLFCWQPLTTTLGTPLIGINTSAGALVFPTGWIPTGAIDLHPGPSNVEDAIVRFTAPTAGTYSISAWFGLIGYDATGTVAAAYGPAGQVFSASLPNASPGFGQFGSTYAFGGNVVLGAGDTLDFGVNNAGSFYGDSTVMTLTVANVPEPAAWAMLITGFGLVGAVARRRRLVAA
jgi:hypothetical protein